MKFSNKAHCEIATKSDVMLAARQRGLISFEFNGISYGAGGIGQSNVEFPSKTKWQSSENAIGVTTTSSMSSVSSETHFPFLILSLLFASLGLAAFVHSSAKESKRTDKSINLLDDSGAGDDPSTKSKKSFKSLASIQAAGSKILEKLSKSFIFNEKDEPEPTIAGITEPSVSFRGSRGDDRSTISARSSNVIVPIQVAGSQSEPATGSAHDHKTAEAELEVSNANNAMRENDVGALEAAPEESFARSTKSKKSLVSIIQIGSKLFRKLSKSNGYDTKKETERFGSENNGVVGENTREKYEDKSAEHRTEDKVAETNVVLDNSSRGNAVEKYEDNTAEPTKEENFDATNLIEI